MKDLQLHPPLLTQPAQVQRHLPQADTLPRTIYCICTYKKWSCPSCLRSILTFPNHWKLSRTLSTRIILQPQRKMLLLNQRLVDVANRLVNRKLSVSKLRKSSSRRPRVILTTSRNTISASTSPRGNIKPESSLTQMVLLGTSSSTTAMASIELTTRKVKRTQSMLPSH